MKTFILINGKTATVRQFTSNDDARDYVTNYFDHSLFVGYYEIDQINLPNSVIADMCIKALRPLSN